MKLPLQFAVLWSLAAPTVVAQSSPEAFEQPRSVSFCQLAADPAAYDRQLLKITAFVTHGFEDFGLVEPGCPKSEPYFGVWLMYGGKTKSNTIYCCPGEGDAGPRAHDLTVEDVPIPLLENATLEGFRQLLAQAPDTTVRATLAGRFFSGAKKKADGGASFRGFGHLGCCSLFVIQEVESFEPHTRHDLDYTAEAGYYEPTGCKEHALRDVDSILLGYSSAQGIARQHLAESGASSWAFDDPQRVALEALKASYKDKLPLLKSVKATPARQVFRWKNGKTIVTVVVTRPYWLSFYAKSGSVAWIATMIKEAECS